MSPLVDAKYMTLAPLLESILPIYEERATKRQLEGKKIEIFEPPIKNDSINLVPLIGHEVEKGKSRDLLAEKMKVGKNKIQKANTDTNSPLVISKKFVKNVMLLNAYTYFFCGIFCKRGRICFGDDIS